MLKNDILISNIRKLPSEIKIIIKDRLIGSKKYWKKKFTKTLKSIASFQGFFPMTEAVQSVYENLGSTRIIYSSKEMRRQVKEQLNILPGFYLQMSRSSSWTPNEEQVFWSEFFGYNKQGYNFIRKVRRKLSPSL